ncbi:hypothetical protein GR7B_00033 [Vibrio phage vB_VcorM_GR7B]|nr:hypothetical protein GR7B_00033 [Vibrio phage vB_VcorM_GR7B]
MKNMIVGEKAMYQILVLGHNVHTTDHRRNNQRIKHGENRISKLKLFDTLRIKVMGLAVKHIVIGLRDLEGGDVEVTLYRDTPVRIGVDLHWKLAQDAAFGEVYTHNKSIFGTVPYIRPIEQYTHRCVSTCVGCGGVIEPNSGRLRLEFFDKSKGGFSKLRKDAKTPHHIPTELVMYMHLNPEHCKCGSSLVFNTINSAIPFKRAEH